MPLVEDDSQRVWIVQAEWFRQTGQYQELKELLTQFEPTGFNRVQFLGYRAEVAIAEHNWPELERVGQEGGPEGGAAPDPADPPRGILGKMKAVVICGPGNNGGDGFVLARLLRRCGWEVEVFLYGTPEKLPPDARANYEKWHGLGEVAGFADLWDYLREPRPYRWPLLAVSFAIPLGGHILKMAIPGDGIAAIDHAVAQVAGQLGGLQPRPGQF